MRKGERLRGLQPRVTAPQARVPTLAVNPGSWRADKRGGKSRFYDLRIWRDQIRPQKLRINPLCEDCQERTLVVRATEVDHVDGDSSNNAPENLRSLCKPCHSMKTARENGSFGNPVKE